MILTYYNSFFKEIVGLWKLLWLTHCFSKVKEEKVTWKDTNTVVMLENKINLRIRKVTDLRRLKNQLIKKI